MPEPSTEQINDYRAKLITHLSSISANFSSPNNQYDIPIHLYIINDDNGNTPYGYTVEYIINSSCDALE